MKLTKYNRYADVMNIEYNPKTNISKIHTSFIENGNIYHSFYNIWGRVTQINGFSRYVIAEEGGVYAVYKKGLKQLKFVCDLEGKTAIKYPQYCLINDEGKREMKLAHVITWEAFNGPKPLVNEQGERMDIHHKDADHLNFRLDNLDLITHSENCAIDKQRRKELKDNEILNS